MSDGFLEVSGDVVTALVRSAEMAERLAFHVLKDPSARTLAPAIEHPQNGSSEEAVS